MATNTANEKASRTGQREYTSAKYLPDRSKAMNATANQRVQRGANRPPGKRKKNSTPQTFPVISTLRTGNNHAGWEETREFAAVGSIVTGPNVTKTNEVSSAIRSSERRQKMSVPTASHTSSKTLSMTTWEIA